MPACRNASAMDDYRSSEGEVDASRREVAQVGRKRDAPVGRCRMECSASVEGPMPAITHSRRYGRIADHFGPDAVCHLCGKPVCSTMYGHSSEFGAETVTLDHIEPQSHGGSDTDVLPAHMICNSFRGAAPVAVARLLLRCGRPRKVSNESRVCVLQAHATGMDIESIAAEVGVSIVEVAEVIYVATQSAGWDANARATATARLLQGEKPRVVALAMGVGTKSIYKLSQAMRLPEQDPASLNSDPYTDAEVRKALAMSTDGATLRQIAAALNRSYKSVSRMLARTRKSETGSPA